MGYCYYKMGQLHKSLDYQDLQKQYPQESIMLKSSFYCQKTKKSPFGYFFMKTSPFIDVKNLTIQYGSFTAVKSLSFKIDQKKTLAIIGESGSGKTSVAMALMRLISRHFIDNKSQFFLEGQEIFSLKPKDFNPLRKKMQIVFQDPFSSFNPRMSIGETIKEGLLIQQPHNAPQHEKMV